MIKYSRLGPLLSRVRYAWISPAAGIAVAAQPAYQYVSESIKYYAVVMVQENKNLCHEELNFQI